MKLYFFDKLSLHSHLFNRLFLYFLQSNHKSCINMPSKVNLAEFSFSQNFSHFESVNNFSLRFSNRIALILYLLYSIFYIEKGQTFIHSDSFHLFIIFHISKFLSFIFLLFIKKIHKTTIKFESKTIIRLV